MKQRTSMNLAQVSNALSKVMASGQKPISIYAAASKVAETLGISRSSAREKVIVLRELNPFFAKGLTTDAAANSGREEILSCLNWRQHL